MLFPFNDKKIITNLREHFNLLRG